MKRKKAAGGGAPPKKARTTRSTTSALQNAGQQQGRLESFFQCPISLERMRDPVVLTQSGNTYDREHLCEALLNFPTKDPKSNVEYNVPLEYAPNVAVRSLLTELHGDEAFIEFYDSYFKGEYNKVWDELMLKKLEEDDDDDDLPFETVLVLADRGHAAAQFEVALAYDGDVKSHNDVAEDFEAAKMWYRKAAEQKHVKAQHNLGTLYYNGKEGVEEPNFKLAVHWFRKAAEGNCAIAQYSLGDCYADDEGVEKSEENEKLAVYWWRKAADQNHAFAQNNLGIAYYNGDGVEKNYEKAVELWRESAKQENDPAQLNLAYAYSKGKGVEQSDTLAVKWWRKAAAHNNAEAQCSLGNAYSKGKGVEKSDALAMEWWTKASEKGFSEAKRHLGRAHAKLARSLLQQAADQGDEDAEKTLGSRLSTVADTE